MATLPSATTTINAEAGALAGGTGYCVVMGCVGTNADTTPRVFASAKSLIAQHGYSPAVDYAALHIENTKQPVLFVGLPVTTAGVASRQDASGVTGTSAITIAAGAAGYLEEVDGILTVTTGGTIGTTGIKFTLSRDGGVSSTPVNLGTASSYTVPYVGIVISFAGGTLIAGDEYTFHTSAPMWGATAISAAKTALVAQQKLSRSWMVIGDVTNSTFAGYINTSAAAYQTSNDRFTYARCNVRDHLPLASMARVTVRMSGTPTLTFLEVGAGSDTITRSAGSFVADGFAIGDVITVAGSVSNNVTAAVTGVSALVLTLGGAAADDLVNEGPVSGCTIVGSHGVTFAEVGGTADTITRSGGSWLDDGFAAGDIITIAGTSSNNITTGALASVTATVLTLGSSDLVAEVIGSRSFTITKGETMAAWVSAMDAAFTSIDGKPHIDIGLGRDRVASPIVGASFRRPAAWFASIREYQHDVHIPTWRKEDGPTIGVGLVDTNGNVVEFDERVDGGGLAGRFTCLRTWSNGPEGAFVAMSLTRDTEGSLLSYTHNMAVTNVACAVVQKATENVVGKVIQLKTDGTATAASLGRIEESVNTDLAIALMTEFVIGEGPRASSAVWTASTTDVLNVVDATLTGVLALVLNGTIVHVNTTVKVT